MQSCIPSNACLIEEIVRGEDLTFKVKNAFKSLFVRTLQNASFFCMVKKNNVKYI